MVRLPQFLIIGAMRAGTTSLYRDLEAHPDIFLPQHKEPNNLCDDAVLGAAGRERYARLFWPARDGQITGEASTAYTKLPDFPGVPQRARALLGPDLKLVYIVREPIARIRSQHHHETAVRGRHLPLDRAVREDPRFVAYSRYAMQLEAWLASYPPEQLFVLRFEDYVTNRRTRLLELCRFLGADPDRLPENSDEAFNKAANRPTASPFWRRNVLEADWYAIYVKPLAPRRLRGIAARLLNPRAPASAEDFSAASLPYLVDALGEETRRFEQLFEAIWPARCVGTPYDPAVRYEHRVRSPAS